MTASPTADRQEPDALRARDPGGAGAAPADSGGGPPPALPDDLVARQRPKLEQMAVALAAQLARRGEGDLVDDFALPFTYTAVCDVVGISPQDRKRLLDRLQEWRRFLLGDDPNLLRCAARTAVYDHISGILADRLENPRDDLATTLAEATRDGRLAAHEAIATAAATLLNGYPQATGFLSGLLLRLLLDLTARDRLAAQPDLIPAAAEDFLREHARGRDGVERCPGVALARLEAQAAVTAMLPHLAGIRLAIPEADLVWSYARFGVVAVLERCPVTWRQFP